MAMALESENLYIKVLDLKLLSINTEIIINNLILNTYAGNKRNTNQKS